MINILIASLFSICIANFLNLVSKKKINFIYLFTGNYLCAFLLSLIGTNYNYSFSLNYDLLIAIILGILFVLNFVVYSRNVQLNGVSLSVSIMRISLIIPLLFSVIIHKEILNSFTSLSIILTLSVSLLLAKADKKISVIQLILLFFISGFTEYIFKLHNSIQLIPDQQFLSILFLSALLFCILIIFIKKMKINYLALIYGMVLGIPNYYTSYFFMKGLNHLDAVICYPLNASLIIFGSYLSDRYLWKNRFSLKQRLLYFSLMISVILLNMSIYLK